MSLLRATPAGAGLVVCNTCRVSEEEREDPQGVRGGALLAAALTWVAPETSVRASTYQYGFRSVTLVGKTSYQMIALRRAQRRKRRELPTAPAPSRAP